MCTAFNGKIVPLFNEIFVSLIDETKILSLKATFIVNIDPTEIILAPFAQGY